MNLKPCPFCGGEAKERLMGRNRMVDCTQCGVSVTINLWNIRAGKLDTIGGEAAPEKLEKDEAYRQRNVLVAALARLYPSGVRRTNIEGWSSDWHGCVYIDLPTGQISYHYHDSQAYMFLGLPAYTKPWDGHDKETVEKRLAGVASSAAPEKGFEDWWRNRTFNLKSQYDTARRAWMACSSYVDTTAAERK